MKSIGRRFFFYLGVLLCLAVLILPVNAQATLGIFSPNGAIIGANANDNIGEKGVHVLPNGNIVIISPDWGNERGAVTCLTPAEYQTGNIIINETNSLVGSVDNGASNPDEVGSGGIVILTNGNYVVVSHNWTNNNTGSDLGAVTWVNGSTCRPANSTTRGAVVSSANSLVGSAATDGTFIKVLALANGNYAVSFINWDNGATVNVGAVIWGNGATGISGAISASNAFIGSTANDGVGTNFIALTNGNYVQGTPFYDNGATVDVGAATWFNGTNGFALGASSAAGTVSSSNSLIGATANDQVSTNVSPEPLVALTNGNYVVRSPLWDNGGFADAGAVTWGNGNGGTVGLVSTSNSLVGSAANNLVGNGPTGVLTNGNYVVRSSNWDNGGTTNAGAVTWGNGTTGTIGTVSVSNSLVGNVANQNVGNGNFIALSNGNYVMNTFNWDNGGASNVGASTWGNGNGGTVGVVSSTNSLIGSSIDDRVGVGFVQLTNGNYLVTSTQWDNGATANVGAITWVNGTTGRTGVVNSTNSLIGLNSGDQLIAIALTNGHYVVYSSVFDNGATLDVGIARWVNGTTGSTGVISTSNSIVGSVASDGNSMDIVPLENGNYVAVFPSWDNGSSSGAGAIRWATGTGTSSGAISPSNALVGASAGDTLREVVPLPNGDYVIVGATWDNGAITDAGFVAIGDGSGGTTVGTINPSLAWVGQRANDEIGSEFEQAKVLVFSNNDFAFFSRHWSSASLSSVGALTWSNYQRDNTGFVSEENSIIGATLNDLEDAEFVDLNNGDYLVVLSNWDNGAAFNVGLIKFFSGANSLTRNSGFEVAGTNAKKSLSWELVNPTGADKRTCNTVSNPLGAFAGNCYIQFSASAGSPPAKARSIKQIITADGWGNTGDVLKLSAMVSGAGLKGKAKIDLTVFYTDGTNTKSSIGIPAGTYAYQKVALGAVISKPVERVQVVISAGKTTGKLKLDSVILHVSVNEVLVRQDAPTLRDGALTLPEPPLPEGFRN